MRRWSARFVITALTVIITTLAVVFIIAIVRQSVVHNPTGSTRATDNGIVAVGLLLVLMSGMAAWWTTSYVLQPLSEMKRKLSLAARTRAIADPETIELEEIAEFRSTLGEILNELENKEREAELAKRSVLAVFERITEGVAQLTADGRFAHVNAAGRALIALPAQPEGRPLTALVHNEELQGILDRAARGLNNESVEVTVRGKQVLITSVPLTVATGEHAGAIVTLIDLTELRRLESVRRDFVANVSHELKTPLTSIRGYAETLLTDDLPAAEQKQFASIIVSNATRLQRIVEELLDLSRLESGGWKPNLDEVDAALLARDVWSSLGETKKIKFNVDGGGYVVADPEALRQVYTNLFENAIRHTPEGGSIDVHFSRVFLTGRVGAFVGVEVRDTGVGIPADSLPRIFERFYRVDAARSRADGGTGLGLSIVKHFIERMAGEVFAVSEPNKGTSIHFRLPESRS